METIQIILRAMVLGAFAHKIWQIAPIIRELYDGLKILLIWRYPHLNWHELEKAPFSKSNQENIKQILWAAQANKDEILFDQANLLLDAIQQYAPHISHINRKPLKRLPGSEASRYFCFEAA